jgi:hypothetical protein
MLARFSNADKIDMKGCVFCRDETKRKGDRIRSIRTHYSYVEDTPVSGWRL